MLGIAYMFTEFEIVVTMLPNRGYIYYKVKALNYQQASMQIRKKLIESGWKQNEFSIYNPFN